MAVLITRPDERGKQLTEALNQHGILALHLPLQEIQAGRELAQLPNKIKQLNAGDYVFLVSAQAVDFATDSLNQIGFGWREDLQYFTVGHRTAQHFSCQSGLCAHYPLRTESSEGLLELPQMADLTGKQILILRGNGGREYFAEQAQLRGAQVDYLECYQRLALQENLDEQINLAIRAGVQCIVATSAEILQRLPEIVPQEEQSWLFNCQLITSSPRLNTLARQLGWQNVVQAAQPDNTTLLNTLTELSQSH